MPTLFHLLDIAPGATEALAKLLDLPATNPTPKNDFHILVSDRPTPVTELGTIVVNIFGEEIVVGPIWSPGTACPCCAQIRRDIRRAQPAVTSEFSDWCRTETKPLFNGISRSLVAEAVSVARRTAALQLYNKVWIFTFGTQLWHEEHIVPVWNCPNCGDASPCGIEAMVAELEDAS